MKHFYFFFFFFFLFFFYWSGEWQIRRVSQLHNISSFFSPLTDVFLLSFNIIILLVRNDTQRIWNCSNFLLNLSFFALAELQTHNRQPAIIQTCVLGRKCDEEMHTRTPLCLCLRTFLWSFSFIKNTEQPSSQVISCNLTGNIVAFVIEGCCLQRSQAGRIPSLLIMYKNSVYFEL